MDENHKKAYRYLLSFAMLDIRRIAWMPFGYLRLLNPFVWRRTVNQIIRAGVIADWLHNLAILSAQDFEAFNEEWFWRDFRELSKRYPHFGLGVFEEVFRGKLERPGKQPSVLNDSDAPPAP